jgi:hypothetical protein
MEVIRRPGRARGIPRDGRKKITGVQSYSGGRLQSANDNVGRTYAFLVAHRDYISEGSKPPLMVRACNQSRGSLFRVSGRDDSLDMIRARFRQTLGITVEEAEAAWLATLR